MRRSIGSVLGFALVLGACEEGPPAVSPVPSATPVSSETAPIVQKDSGADTATAFSGTKVCGCSLCEPVVSDDACTKDDDCAPKTACHAKACVAKANAEVRGPNTMCTQDLHCDSIDANKCGCLKGKCALQPK
jgi:hypothetical protein